MRPLHLDFLHPARRRGAPGMVLLIAGIACVAGAAWQFTTLRQSITQIEARLTETQRMAQRQRPPVAVSPAEAKLLAQDVGRANAVLASLNVPWDRLFRDLETASSEAVGLTGVQPEGGGRQVRITGEARRFEDVLAYVKRLEATPGLANVLLASHEMRTGAALRTFQFTVVADWIGRR